MPHTNNITSINDKREIAQEAFYWLMNKKHAGYDRSDLPQIPYSKEQFVIDTLGLIPRHVFAKDLKPSQTQIKKSKVIDKIDTGQNTRLFFVSKDGYLVDGHHSWATLLPENEVIKIYQSTEMDIHEFIRVLIDDFGFSSKSINESLDDADNVECDEYCSATYQRILKLYRNVSEVDKNRAKSILQFLGKKWNQDIKSFCKSATPDTLDKVENNLRYLVKLK